MLLSSLRNICRGVPRAPITLSHGNIRWKGDWSQNWNHRMAVQNYSRGVVEDALKQDFDLRMFPFSAPFSSAIRPKSADDDAV